MGAAGALNAGVLLSLFVECFVSYFVRGWFVFTGGGGFDQRESRREFLGRRFPGFDGRVLGGGCHQEWE